MRLPVLLKRDMLLAQRSLGLALRGLPVRGATFLCRLAVWWMLVIRTRALLTLVNLGNQISSDNMDHSVGPVSLSMMDRLIHRPNGARRWTPMSHAPPATVTALRKLRAHTHARILILGATVLQWRQELLWELELVLQLQVIGATMARSKPLLVEATAGDFRNAPRLRSTNRPEIEMQQESRMPMCKCIATALDVHKALVASIDISRQIPSHQRRCAIMPPGQSTRYLRRRQMDSVPTTKSHSTEMMLTWHPGLNRVAVIICRTSSTVTTKMSAVTRHQSL